MQQPLAALLALPASPAPRPRLGPSRRPRPAVVRAAALRALPRRLGLWPPRLAAVESTPPAPAPDAQSAGSGLDAGVGGGDGGGDGGGGADLGWLRVFPHVLTASMANFLFGYHIGVMNGPIEDIARELGFQGNPFLQGLVVSIFIVGAFFGSLGSSALVDYFGCKRTLQIDSIPLIIGALVSAQADSLDEMLLGRFLVGIGIGVNTVLVPLYISEVAPTKYRGSLGTLCQIGTCLGIIAALSLGIPSESDPHWWRTMLYAACVPGVLIVVGMQFAVESPRWLAKVGRFDDARKVVESLWGPSDVEKSMEKIKAVVVSDDDSQASWSELLVEPHNRVALIGGSLFFLQQFAGINGVLYFSSLTFRDVGITSGALASLYVGITNFGGAIVASNLMDKQGRKKLLIGSYLGMVHFYFFPWCWASYRYHYTRAEQCSDTVKSYGLQLYCTLDM
ncbi:probable plastidic glucose transporter 1 isoform X2 [Phragmites australis]|uniref:probable plastidic glucose transporter 1 isoform X2 n=1 Tax=Phragmites australis TaxID=29695 RepID=UPI002D78E0AC|nr:probable plastidic glucose transporter 1 isoform X2 [Phragmites australis]